MTEFEQVAVLGFGTMGAGIAQVIAQSGRRVVVLEADEIRIEAGFQAMGKFLDDGVRRGKTTEVEKAALLERVRGTTTITDLSEVDLVIEAITERRDTKREMFGRLSDVVPSDAIVATNTSALSVSDLATSVANPSRFAGLHFFNPPQLMRVIEVVVGVESDPAVVSRLSGFVNALGKVPIEVKDRPGFLVNRLLMPYLNDVIQAYDEELATAEDLDTAMKLGLGYKLGPLELLDLIGLDVHNHATRSAYDATLDPTFAPPPLLQTMVAAGRHGNKNGRGFRTHTDGGTAQ
ncbi:3-hydroxyacyl-CoA dehydrogenase family protein [Streptomyces sp. NPDC090088]|uniref:3-hydroxyacyl-CoA dehydrogenase family protein n=1 Tax=Streptomyces sp. NPDC090088 TaxID=3365944 RepID=UPI003807BF0D